MKNMPIPASMAKALTKEVYEGKNRPVAALSAVQRRLAKNGKV